MIATIVISVLLAAVVAMIIFRMVKNRGKSSCGCDCDGCSAGAAGSKSCCAAPDTSNE